MRRINDLLPLKLIRPRQFPLMMAALVLSAAPAVLGGWEQAIAQALPALATASRSAWPVALPATATVRLKQGASLSGRLVKLTASTITLALGQQSQTLELAKVSSIEFTKPNDLWVTLPNGRRQLRPIRGLSLPIDALPSSAIQVERGSDTALVDLTAVLSEAQFAKLTRNPDLVYVLNWLEVSADGSIRLRVRPYGVQ